MRVLLYWNRNWCRGESAKPVFFLSVWWQGREREVSEGFLGCLLSQRKEGCLQPRALSKQLPLAPGSSLLFKAWVRELHKPWAFRAEEHSTENEEEWQYFTPKACQGRTSWLYFICAKTTLWSHTLWSSNQLFSIHCIISRCSVKVIKGRSP